MGVSTGRRSVVHVVDGSTRRAADDVAVEAPLTIVLDGEILSTTMRTPGHDLELVAGWLVNESGVRRSDDISTMAAVSGGDETVDTVRVRLAAGVRPPRARAFVTTSACGVCSADVLAAYDGPDGPLHSTDWSLAADRVPALQEEMRAGQRLFDRAGSLHAAALATPDLRLLATREDVGRHNAVDKAIGHALLADRLPLTDHTLLVSGRVSYEIVHKALTAGVGAVVAVSGPTSLAIDLARAHGLVLVGFARGDRMNVYSGDDRVRIETSS